MLKVIRHLHNAYVCRVMGQLTPILISLILFYGPNFHVSIANNLTSSTTVLHCAYSKYVYNDNLYNVIFFCRGDTAIVKL